MAGSGWALSSVNNSTVAHQTSRRQVDFLRNRIALKPEFSGNSQSSLGGEFSDAGN